MKRKNQHKFVKQLTDALHKISKKTKKKQTAPLKKKKRNFDKILNFSQYVTVAGYKSSPKKIHRNVIQWSVILSILVYATLILYSFGKSTLLASVLTNIVWFILAIPASYLGIWLMFYVVTDFKVAHRREQIEKALPDYLQMAASNIRAGMPIDRALWFAIRPRFGILATEMEFVAKQTMSGEKLEHSLQNLSKKYDSDILTRTVSLILEGLRAGSEIGALLENISIDITEMYQQRDNMAANVTQYLIFILFAVAVAAPLLFGMSIQLLTVLNTIGSDILSDQAGTSSGPTSGFTISLSGEAVTEGNFFIFCILSLLATSLMSSIIVSNIKHGHGREAVKLAPVIAVISIVLFFISSWGLSLMFADLI